MEYLFGEVHANRTYINLLNFKIGQYARFVVVIIEAILDIYLQNVIFLTVTDMYTLELGVFMYRFSITDLPVAFKEYFKKRSEIHDYPTRHVNDLNLTNNKKFFSDHSIRTNGPILWNSLSKTLKESKTIRYFRNQFKQKLIQTYK